MNKMIDLKERRSDEQIKKERTLINSLEYFKDVFNSISTVTLVLNETRQILFASNNFLGMLQLSDDNSILGYRAGEVISCIHAKESPHGCNNSSSCSLCGTLQALKESGRTNSKVTRESRITSLVNDNIVSWDLSVTSVPIKISNRLFYIVTMTDISSEKRKKQLERIFIHDLVNSAGGISGLSEALESLDDETTQKDVVELLGKTSKNLLEQILSYRHLISAESGELEVKISQINTSEFIKECITIVSNNKTLKANVVIFPSSEDVTISTDKILLSRILINMIKNAVEAEDDLESVVEVGATQINGNLRLWVKNNSIIPKETQKQIFQRSFSTKGGNRGLGTYSMKLLGENYLKGKVDFISNSIDKTVFYFELPS